MVQGQVCLSRCGLENASAAARGKQPVDPDVRARYHSNVRTNNAKPLPLSDAAVCDIPCFKGDLVARLRRAMPKPARLEQARVVFGALADGNRLRILYALKDGEELCVCDVAHVLGTSISTASHHLRKLRDLDILADRDDGKMVYYSLRDSDTAALAAAVLAQVA